MFRFAFLMIVGLGGVAHAFSYYSPLSEPKSPSTHGATSSDIVLQGTVTDRSGAVIADADVTVTCNAYTARSKSGSDGRYVLAVKHSTCTVNIVRSGFAPYSQVIDGTAQEALTLNASLALPSDTAVVNVSARADAIDVSKINADPMDLPLAVATVPNQLVADQGFTRLLDALRNVSGVTIKEAYFGVTDDFNVRGFDASISLFNGFRRDYYQTVNDVSSLERVEVIKGPSSVTEGFLEPGGVVNVVTKSPLPETLASVDFLADSFGTARGQGDVNLPLSRNFFLRGTGALEHRASFRDFVEDEIDSAGLALNWTPTSSTLLESRFYNTYLSGVPDRGLPAYAIDPAIIFTLPIQRFTGDPQDQYKQRNTDFSETLHQGLGGTWSLRMGVNYFQLSDHRNNVEDDSQDATYPELIDRELTVVDGDNSILNGVVEASGEATTFYMHHHLSGGVDYQRLTSTGPFTENFNLPLFNPVQPNYGGFSRVPGPVTYFDPSYTYDTGSYVQDLLTFGRFFRVLAGARQDQFNYHDHEQISDVSVRLRQGAFSPRVGIVFQPVPVLSLYANYASSFNPQQGVQLLNGEPPTPSRGRQVEVGVKYAPNNRFSATADLFRIRKTNVATPVINDGDFEQLTGEEQNTGAELDATCRVSDSLTLRGNLADMRAIVTADNSLPVGSRLNNVPRLQGAIWAEGNVPHTRLSAAFGWFGVGQQEATLPNTLLVPKYNRFDGALYYTLPRGFKLQANVQNFSNVRYYTLQNDALFPGAPAHAVISLHWTRQHEH